MSAWLTPLQKRNKDTVYRAVKAQGGALSTQDWGAKVLVIQERAG